VIKERRDLLSSDNSTGFGTRQVCEATNCRGVDDFVETYSMRVMYISFAICLTGFPCRITESLANNYLCSILCAPRRVVGLTLWAQLGYLLGNSKNERVNGPDYSLRLSVLFSLNEDEILVTTSQKYPV
jgi:hypothetical protein